MRAYVIRKIAVSGTVFIDKIIRKLGASDLLFPYCREYLFVLLLFTPAGILQVLFQNLIVTAGRPGIGMALGVSAGIANILLDYIFMAPLQMGIRGAALGTGIGYMIPAAAGILFFSARKSSLRFFPSDLRADYGAAADAARIFRRNGCMACRTRRGAFDNDCGTGPS